MQGILPYACAVVLLRAAAMAQDLGVQHISALEFLRIMQLHKQLAAKIARY